MFPQENDDDGELRRSSYRKRTVSGSSRRSSAMSASASTNRPLTTTSPPHSAHSSSPMSSRPNSPSTMPATVSLPASKPMSKQPSNILPSTQRYPYQRFHTFHYPPSPSSRMHVDSLFIIAPKASPATAAISPASGLDFSPLLGDHGVQPQTGFSASLTKDAGVAGHHVQVLGGELQARDLLSQQSYHSQSWPSLVSLANAPANVAFLTFFMQERIIWYEYNVLLSFTVGCGSTTSLTSRIKQIT